MLAPPRGPASWRPQPFSEATLSLPSALGELRFSAALTSGKPPRLARVSILVDGAPVQIPAQVYRDVVNPRLQETMALLPVDCAPGGCEATAAVLIRYYPALGSGALPRTAACASSYLRLVLDRQQLRRASIVECMNSKHERERVVYPGPD